jgi:ABC-type amino acid transport substrate-binding protein
MRIRSFLVASLLALTSLVAPAAGPATPAAPAAPAKAASAPAPGASAAAAAAAQAVSEAARPNGLVRMPNGSMVAPEIARILQRGELVVAMLGVDSPPFFFALPDGNLAGTDVRMAQGLAQELNVKLRIDRSARSFNEVVEIVARGNADMGISKLSRTLARAQTVRFSDPYLSLNHALILNRLEFAKLTRDKPLPTVIRNYTGSLAVIDRSSFADFAKRNFPHAQIRRYPSWELAVEAVKRGEVVAAYRDEFEIRRLLKADPGLALTLRTVTLKDLEDTLGIVVGIGDTTLLAFVNQFLAQRTERLTAESVLNELK